MQGASCTFFEHASSHDAKANPERRLVDCHTAIKPLNTTGLWACRLSTCKMSLAEHLHKVCLRSRVLCSLPAYLLALGLGRSSLGVCFGGLGVPSPIAEDQRGFRKSRDSRRSPLFEGTHLWPYGCVLLFGTPQKGGGPLVSLEKHVPSKKTHPYESSQEYVRLALRSYVRSRMKLLGMGPVALQRDSERLGFRSEVCQPLF